MIEKVLEFQELVEGYILEQAEALGLNKTGWSLSVKIKLTPPKSLEINIELPAVGKRSIDQNLVRRFKAAADKLDLPFNTMAKIVVASRATMREWLSGKQTPPEDVVALFEKRAEEKLETLASLDQNQIPSE